MNIYFGQTAPPMVIYFTGGFNFNSYDVGGGGLVADGNYGDITVAGAGSNWFINTGVVESGNIAARTITFDKLPEVGASKFLGRHNATAGDIQEIGIDGGLEFHGSNLRRSQLTGAITAAAGSNSTTLATGIVTSANLGGDITQAGLNLITGADNTIQRQFLGLGSASIANTGDFAAFAHTHPVSGLEQSGASTGQIIQWDGFKWAPATSSGAGTDSQIFTTTGTYTWTNPSPSTRKLGRARLIGGGGGGGSGRKGAVGTVRCGGGGGAGACVNEFWFWTDTLAASVAVTVGAGGAGGASVSADSTNGNAGLIGGTSFFGVWRGYPGNPGQGGTNASGLGGTAFGNSMLIGGIVGSNVAGANAPTNGGAGGSISANNQYIPTGAGSGGGITSGNVASSGGNGGSQGSLYTSGPSAPGVGGTPGANGSPGSPFANGTGLGGGGGGGSTVGNAGNGANGNGPGGPGGGGGAATDGVGDSGAGGNGAPGLVEIVVWL